MIIGALDGTFQRKPFGTIIELIPLAEHVTKLNAVCFKCSRDAAFSKRIVEGDEVEVIGGADKYVAACRQCFLSDTEDKKKEELRAMMRGMLRLGADATKAPEMQMAPAPVKAADDAALSTPTAAEAKLLRTNPLTPEVVPQVTAVRASRGLFSEVSH